MDKLHMKSHQNSSSRLGRADEHHKLVNPDSSKLSVIGEYTLHQAYQILNNQLSSPASQLWTLTRGIHDIESRTRFSITDILWWWWSSFTKWALQRRPWGSFHCLIITANPVSYNYKLKKVIVKENLTHFDNWPPFIGAINRLFNLA